MKKILLLTFFFLGSISNWSIIAQDNNSISNDITEIDDLLNMDIVIASKKSESSFESPLSTTVLTRDAILQSGATTIEEALKLVPGMIVREESNGNYDIHIRGNDNIPPGSYTLFSENTMTLIMVNNRKVYNYSNGGVFWETLPISVNDVERIEIIRGPSTALYGPNAVSGVINIVTAKSADKKLSANGSAQYGSLNTGIYEAAVASSLMDNRLKLRVSANSEKRDRSTTDYYSWIAGDYVAKENLINYTSPSTAPLGDKASVYYEYPELSKERGGINGAVEYEVNEKFNLSLEGGFQESLAQTVFMETTTTPLTFRESESTYFNFNSSVYGFTVQLSGSAGSHEIYKGNPSARYDFSIFDGQIEYNYEYKNLSIRPGLSYQTATYTDLPYASTTVSGYINSEQELNSFAYFLRGDYKAFEKIRLIAALRVDQYNVPDEDYLTYQLIGTYEINNNNIIRLSHSKANRGPMIIDFYTNYNSQTIRYVGNPDLNLPTMVTTELGYRSKLSSIFQVDGELFYSETKDFTSFEPVNVDAFPIVYGYKNITAVAKQLGATLSLNLVPSSKYQFKVWGTYQNTQLENFEAKTQNLVPPTPTSPTTFLPGKLPVYTTENIEHTNTPAFYGGVDINAKPIEKLNINANLYFTDKYDYRHDYQLISETTGIGNGQTTVDAKINLNIKVAYKVYKNNQIYINARNLVDNDKSGFAFADPVTPIILGGISF